MNRSSAARLRQQLKAKTRDERKVKRAQFAKDRSQRQRFPSQALLEQEAVSDRVAVDYQHRYVEFQTFSKIQKMSMRGLVNLDTAFVSFLNHMFLEGVSVGEASKTMAAVVGMASIGRPTEPGCLDHSDDVGEEAAVRGCFSDAHVCGVSQAMGAAGYEQGGLGDAKSIVPSPRHQPSSIVSRRGVQDRAQGRVSPARQQGHAISWKMPAAGTIDAPARDAPSRALLQIGLSRNHAILHQLRHSGPSYDKLVNARTMLEIKMQ